MGDDGFEETGTAAVRVRGLRKRFGATVALDGLDLDVRPGEVAGFLGPNGAGKSTTLRVLLGMLRADAGQVQVLGGDPRRDAVVLHARLAYVPGDVALWPHLTAGETVDLLLGLRGVTPDARARAAALERFGLDPTRRAGTLSKGNRQKVALVAAFAVPVDLLVLDEPTSGLDPLVEAVFQDAVREVRARGGAVLLSSHLLGEVEALCDTVTIVRDGRTVAAGALEDLRGRTRSRVVGVLGDGAAAARVAALAGVHDPLVEPGADGVRLAAQVEAAQVPAVVTALAAAGVRGLVVEPPSLQELFLGQYRGQYRGQDRGRHRDQDQGRHRDQDQGQDQDQEEP